MEKFPSDSVLIKNLEKELTHGGELAGQLQLHMNAQSSSQETLLYLLNEILNTYDRALSVIEHGGRIAGGASGMAPPGCGGVMAATMSDSPGTPLTASPHSSHSNQEDQACRISGSKGVPRWTQRETAKETQLDDGHRWRKYGQKDSLRSKNPRGYYRCTQGKGCLARKQIQRSDEDPTTFEVTYKGLHTCRSDPSIAFPIIHHQNEPKTPSISHENRINQSQQEPFLNIQTSLKIIDSSYDKQCNIPSTSNFNPENDPIFPDDHLLWEDYLKDFMYPTAPELNYFNDYEMLINNSRDIESEPKPPTQDADSSFDSSSGQLGSSFGLGN
ncbi:probable WRKY transcription factor 41 [Primulina huaijiensis]|uniref:probable WRKY transcription factor 41 n=1 Tax=Primulina huaijiensis TaxID=1492673 RepID=UPI003CC76E5F